MFALVVQQSIQCRPVFSIVENALERFIGEPKLETRECRGTFQYSRRNSDFSANS